MVQPTKTVKARPSVAQTRQSAPPQAERRAGARAIGSFVPRITKAAFEKFGFSTAQLLSDWPKIAGPALAAYTAPERIVWPRRASGEPGESSQRGPQPGATLHLLVDPARALEVQYGQSLLIDRINAYFGYRAVSGIRLIQAVRAMEPGAAAQVPRAGKPAGTAGTEPTALAGFSDAGLQAALERMRAGLVSRK